MAEFYNSGVSTAVQCTGAIVEMLPMRVGAKDEGRWMDAGWLSFVTVFLSPASIASPTKC